MAVWRTVYPAADIGKWINGEMDEEFLNIIEQSRSLGPRSRRYWKAVFLPAISLPVNVVILLLFQFIWIWPLPNYLGTAGRTDLGFHLRRLRAVIARGGAYTLGGGNGSRFGSGRASGASHP
jgi:hypothetical protein